MKEGVSGSMRDMSLIKGHDLPNGYLTDLLPARPRSCRLATCPSRSVVQVSGYPPWTSGSCAFRVPSLGWFGLLLLGFFIFAGWGDPRGSVYRLPNLRVVIYHYLAIFLSCFLSSFCLYELYSSLGDYLSLVLDNKPVHNSVWNFLRL